MTVTNQVTNANSVTTMVTATVVTASTGDGTAHRGVTMTITVIATVVTGSIGDDTAHQGVRVTVQIIATVLRGSTDNGTVGQKIATGSHRNQTVELQKARICRNFAMTSREYSLVTTVLSKGIPSNMTTFGRSSRSMKSESKKPQLRLGLRKLTYRSLPSRHWAYLPLTTLSTR